MGRSIESEPARAECHIWWARPAALRDDLDSLLTADERVRREGLALRDDRWRFTVARALARAAIGAHFRSPPDPLPFSVRCKQCGGAHGKPRLPGAGPTLSWSRSGRWVVVATARSAEVGVDVEAIPTAGELYGLPEIALSADERRVLASRPPGDWPGALLTYWTRKEAALKATADGLSVPLSALRVSAPDEPARLVAWNAAPAPHGRVHLHDLSPGPGHVGALAVLTDRAVRVLEHDGERLLSGDRGRRAAGGDATASRRASAPRSSDASGTAGSSR